MYVAFVTLSIASSVVVAPPAFDYRAPVMGTMLEIRIILGAGHARDPARRAALRVQAEFDRLEALLSEWRPDSPLGRLNAAPTESIEVPLELFSLVQRSLDWSRRTSGAFDPTFASLWGLWRFQPGDETRIPSRATARARARLIDYTKVELDSRRRTLRLAEAGMKLGLGGIAKGYAVDRGVAILRSAGYTNFFVKAGGELYLSGTRGDRPWLAGAEDPRDPDRYFAMVAIENAAFTSSGDYKRFLIKDGVRYHHIIDPATGYPATRCRGVTIIAPFAEDADALSTSVFVLGPERGLALVEGLAGVEALIVTAAGRAILSSGLRGKIELRELTPYQGP